uniref:Uncharacterized protein n=1 Tax=Arundo donax TaxID=35708 RepID=A0A0A9A7D8_ARUDO
MLCMIQHQLHLCFPLMFTSENLICPSFLLKHQ